MSDIVFYILLQVIIILAMAAFLFFSLWRSERSLASNYHELAKKSTNPANTTENTLISLKKILLKELKKIDKISEKQQNTSDDQRTPLMSILQTRRIIVETELGLVEDMINNINYQRSLRKNIKVLLEKLSVLHPPSSQAPTDPIEDHRTVSTFKELITALDQSQIQVSRTLKEKFEDLTHNSTLNAANLDDIKTLEESYNLMLEVSEDLQVRYETLLTENEHLQTALNDALKSQDNSAISTPVDVATVVPEHEELEDYSFDTYVDLTQRLINEIDDVRSEKNKISKSYTLLEQQQARDEREYSDKMSRLKTEKETLLKENSNLITRLNSKPLSLGISSDSHHAQDIPANNAETDSDINVIKTLNRIEREKREIEAQYQCQLGSLNTEKESLKRNIKKLESENQQLNQEIDNIKGKFELDRQRALDAHLKSYQEEKNHNDEKTKKMVKKLTKLFEYNQINSERLENSIKEKEETIRLLNKRLNTQRSETEDISKAMSKNYSNIINQKDRKIQNLEQRISTLQEAMRAMKG